MGPSAASLAGLTPTGQRPLLRETQMSGTAPCYSHLSFLCGSVGLVSVRTQTRSPALTSDKQRRIP